MRKDFIEGGLISAVSTIEMFDAAGYETAVGLPVGGFAGSGSWFPVERYRTADEASRGHERWLGLAPTLTKVTSLGLPDSLPKIVNLAAEMERLTKGRDHGPAGAR